MFAAELQAESFFTLAHCADQTHAGDCKAEQGYTCMDLVDTDRLVISSDTFFMKAKIFMMQ